jgi:hypothetical protein
VRVHGLTCALVCVLCCVFALVCSFVSQMASGGGTLGNAARKLKRAVRELQATTKSLKAAAAEEVKGFGPWVQEQLARVDVLAAERSSIAKKAAENYKKEYKQRKILYKEVCGGCGGGGGAAAGCIVGGGGLVCAPPTPLTRSATHLRCLPSPSSSLAAHRKAKRAGRATGASTTHRLRGGLTQQQRVARMPCLVFVSGFFKNIVHSQVSYARVGKTTPPSRSCGHACCSSATLCRKVGRQAGKFASVVRSLVGHQRITRGSSRPAVRRRCS